MSTSRRRAIKLVLDWDGTMTCKDTLQLVAKIGYDKHGLPLDGHPTIYRPPAMSWRSVGSRYMEKYSAHKETYVPRAEDRTTLSAERAWLASLRPVEAFGAHTAEQTLLFRSLTEKDVAKAAREAVDHGSVQFRAGWAALITHAIELGSWSILSVNWSASFIRDCILAKLENMEHNNSCNQVLRYMQMAQLHIEANEIQGLGRPQGSSGRLTSDKEDDDIRTSADKLLRLPESDDRDNTLVVYCGDSDTDLECLLSADIGICMVDESSSSAQRALASTLSRLQIPALPIEHMNTRNMLGRGLWTAIDFNEVLAALRRVDHS